MTENLDRVYFRNFGLSCIWMYWPVLYFTVSLLFSTVRGRRCGICASDVMCWHRAARFCGDDVLPRFVQTRSRLVCFVPSSIALELLRRNEMFTLITSSSLIAAATPSVRPYHIWALGDASRTCRAPNSGVRRNPPLACMAWCRP